MRCTDSRPHCRQALGGAQILVFLLSFSAVSDAQLCVINLNNLCLSNSLDKYGDLYFFLLNFTSREFIALEEENIHRASHQTLVYMPACLFLCVILLVCLFVCLKGMRLHIDHLVSKLK